MKTITARNVNDALVLGLSALDEEGVDRDSRNGPVRVFTGPVTTHYKHPEERVLFFPERDANPFFHFMESLWMIASRNDVEWISQFSANIANYSDDGVTFHGAYGARWRRHFLIEHTENLGMSDFPNASVSEIQILDQLQVIADLLRQNPDDRRIVLQMWDASSDLGMDGKDFPCNLICTFRINPYGKLDMTVFNRSNDMIWGAYGANAVHFSVLQEVMAAWIGVPMGGYWQISTNFHSYHETLQKHGSVVKHGAGFDPYELGEVRAHPIVNTPIENWFTELDVFMNEGAVLGFQDPFFKKTAVPMLAAWESWKDKDNPDRVKNAIKFANEIKASDWRRACVEWLERRA